MDTIFAADIGGTKSELAVFRKTGGDIEILCQQRYQNKDFDGFQQLFAEFLQTNKIKTEAACLAVAGPVHDNRVQMTNLDWDIDGGDLVRKWSLGTVRLVNDMTALCQVLPHLSANELITIQNQPPGNQVYGVIAPGTGLGEGFIVQLDEQTLAIGAEGGHTDFGPASDEQMALLAWMRKKEQPVNYESLIAGPGLPLLYDFISEYHQLSPRDEVAARMAVATDRSVVIVGEVASGGGCPLCRRTVELFLEILGSEAGNLALKVNALGGIFLGGGILPRLTGQVSYDRFLEQFSKKGKMADLMARIPIHLITSPHPVLTGAAWYGFEHFS